MWLFVFFDLPVNTKGQRKNASLFRKNLEKITDKQYSDIINFWSTEKAETLMIPQQLELF